MSNLILKVIALTLFALLVGSMFMTDDSMVNCEQTHSHDVCFTSLNN